MTEGRNMDIGYAISMVKQGFRATRAGWNGKDQFIELAGGISYTDPAGHVVNEGHQDIGHTAIAFHGTRGVQVGWLASQADLLAEDWMIFKEGENND